MFTLKRILVPVDFSSASKNALELALDFARTFGASVDVLHVWEIPLYIVPETLVTMPGRTGQSLEEFTHERAEEEMKDFLAPIPPENDLKVSHRIIRGEPWRTIVEIARSEGQDLIIMGTHGRRGLEHFLMGSVTEKVLRHAPCPVLTVRRREAEPAKEAARR